MANTVPPDSGSIDPNISFITSEAEDIGEQLVDGDGTTIDRSVPGKVKVNTAGGTGPGTTTQVAFFDSSNTVSSPAGSGTDSLTWDAINKRLGIGQTVPQALLHVGDSVDVPSTVGDNAVILGRPKDSVSIGESATILNGSVAANEASGVDSLAIGSACTASAQSSFAGGNSSQASLDGAFAHGNNVTASGSYSHAEGNNNTASGSYSHTEGSATLATGYASHAEGYSTHATNDFAHSEGSSTVASGVNSHAEGTNTFATGDNSHAEGDSTQVNANYGHAEGRNTIVTGVGGHAEGQNTEAGILAHSGGLQTHAIGNYSFVHGNTGSDVGYNGCLVFSDSTGANPSASNTNQAIFQYQHGVNFNTSALFVNNPVTQVNGGVSGTLYWSMPQQGSGHKKVIIVLDAYNDVAGTTITFPTAFAYTPSLFKGDGVVISVGTLTTTQIVIPAAAGITGVLIVEGF